MTTDPSLVMSAKTNRGVMTTPSRLDTDAETTAALTCPRAIATKVIEDCTVDGTSVRKRKPAASGSPSTGVSAHLPRSPRAGNSRNVAASTTECNRQCFTPASSSRGSNRAP